VCFPLHVFTLYIFRKAKQPLYLPGQAKGPRRFTPPEILGKWHMKTVRLSAQRTGRFCPSPPSTQVTLWYSFLLESVTPKSHGAAGRIKSIKNPTDLIYNRTRYLPVCSAVPQPPSRALYIFCKKKLIKLHLQLTKISTLLSSGLILCSLASGFGEIYYFCFTSALKYSSKAGAST